MGDQWEARISAIENIQEEFGHDIQEMKEQLARLTNLFKDHIKVEEVHPRGPSPLPNQQVPRSFVPTTSYLPCKTDRPNLQQPRPPTPPAFRTTYRPTDLPSASRGKPNRQKIEKDKPRWDPIPITYIELFPKLVNMGHIEPIQVALLRGPVSKMVQCPHSMRLPWRESRSPHGKLHYTQIQGPRSDQQRKTEV